jgi:hypothetical protein
MFWGLPPIRIGGRYVPPLLQYPSSILEIACSDPRDSGASLGPSSARSPQAILGIRTPAGLMAQRDGCTSLGQRNFIDLSITIDILVYKIELFTTLFYERTFSVAPVERQMGNDSGIFLIFSIRR